MNNKFVKAFLPAIVAVSSLGVGAAVVAAPAGAATKSAAVTKPVVTLTGTVTKVLAAKHTFWFKVGAKTDRVAYSTKTTFTKGSAAALAKGLSVTVTGSYVGKSTSLVSAKSIAA
jgi:hypothetical protein